VGRTRNPRMVGGASVAGLAEELIAAVAVADRVGAEVVGLVHGGAEIEEAVRVRLDEQDPATGADGRDHLDVKSDLLTPADVPGGRRRAPALGGLPEAPARRRARRQPELAAVHAEVGGAGPAVVR